MENLTIFDDIAAYCMFVGYARSGHSLIGALLDAHPNVIISDQLDALKYVQGDVEKQHLFEMILLNSQESVKRGRTRGGHSYCVSGQWQGRFTTLRVIGDKKGQQATVRMSADPKLLWKLEELLGLPVKLFHVIRNPYDNIATKYLKRLRRGPVDLQTLIDEHFMLCQTVADIKQQVTDDNLLDIPHEAMIENPIPWLQSMCRFLGINCPDDYTTACSKIIFSSPNKSRRHIAWSQSNIEHVRAKMASYDFLSGYSFEM
tara:strand:+ start:4045 stop:4821 length:777 start_codon:yes stop_codon:yes gene_type:complete